MKTLITICARGGSKGIPGKNIKELNGHPLIYYTLMTAVTFASERENVHIYLSTDSEEIRAVVQDLNFASVNTSYIRPAKLATDSAGKLAVIKDVLDFAENERGVVYDFVIDMDITSPLRTVQDLEQAYNQLQGDSGALNIFSVSPANRNPYFNMVEYREGEAYVKLVKEGNFLTRQSAPKVYDMNASFYIFKREFFNFSYSNNITNKTLIYVVPHICFDLDHPIDFDFMSFLLKNNKLGFNFLP
ncbi:acylneuraminate cytidylyltransferase family protein [Salinimicrobium sp. HB62]|uniref:acylneuraminate cytidylyltransferase family protein n=1 Tax=Salinimicrobium sp. HB62 TaxID=3077781 RepID=UPI002D7656C6|nr:acylneuraminate cytidylyltransferase family protein [Salinimicrobium sp. HB62]